MQFLLLYLLLTTPLTRSSDGVNHTQNKEKSHIEYCMNKWSKNLNIRNLHYDCGDQQLLDTPILCTIHLDYTQTRVLSTIVIYPSGLVLPITVIENLK